MPYYLGITLQNQRTGFPPYTLNFDIWRHNHWSDVQLEQRALSQALPICRADKFFNVLFHKKINVGSITRVSSVFLREREKERERERERVLLKYTCSIFPFNKFRKYTSCWHCNSYRARVVFEVDLV